MDSALTHNKKCFFLVLAGKLGRLLRQSCCKKLSLSEQIAGREENCFLPTIGDLLDAAGGVILPRHQ